MPPKSKLWGHVRVQSEKDEHGNVEMECVHCQLSFSGNANRIGHHLAGTGSNITACEMCPPDVADEAKTALNRGQLQKKLQVKISRSRSDSEIDLASDTGSPPKAAKYTTAGTASIKSLLSKQTKHEVMHCAACDQRAIAACCWNIAAQLQGLRAVDSRLSACRWIELWHASSLLPAAPSTACRAPTLTRCLQRWPSMVQATRGPTYTTCAASCWKRRFRLLKSCSLPLCWTSWKQQVAHLHLTAGPLWTTDLSSTSCW